MARLSPPGTAATGVARMTMSYYGPDLAFIHDRGFGQLATGAARTLVDALCQRRITDGLVVDVGCGSGLTARDLTGRGYAVLGVDLSDALIARARQQAPLATFRVGSFVDMAVPPAVAACAIGEVLNYAFDGRSDGDARRAFFRRVYDALGPGGLFLFDVAGPSRAPDRPTRSFVEHDDWAVLVETAAEEAVLCRRIVTYRREGALYRRDEEIHRLRLVPPADVVSELRAVGFDVSPLDRYDDTPLPPGLHGFLASKGR